MEHDSISEQIERIRTRYFSNPKLRERYAYEWYVETQDLIYWRLTLDIIKSWRNRLTAIAVTNAVISIAALSVVLFALL